MGKVQGSPNAFLCRYPVSSDFGPFGAAVRFLEGWKFSTSTWQGFVEQTSRAKTGPIQSKKLAERQWSYVHVSSCFSTFEIEVDMISILAASTWWIFTVHNLKLRGKINISNSLVAHRSPLKHDPSLSTFAKTLVSGEEVVTWKSLVNFRFSRKGERC